MLLTFLPIKSAFLALTIHIKSGLMIQNQRLELDEFPFYHPLQSPKTMAYCI